MALRLRRILPLRLAPLLRGCAAGCQPVAPLATRARVDGCGLTSSSSCFFSGSPALLLLLPLLPEPQRSKVHVPLLRCQWRQARSISHHRWLWREAPVSVSWVELLLLLLMVAKSGCRCLRGRRWAAVEVEAISGAALAGGGAQSAPGDGMCLCPRRLLELEEVLRGGDEPVHGGFSGLLPSGAAGVGAIGCSRAAGEGGGDGGGNRGELMEEAPASGAVPGGGAWEGRAAPVAAGNERNCATRLGAPRPCVAARRRRSAARAEGRREKQRGRGVGTRAECLAPTAARALRRECEWRYRERGA